MNKFLIIVIIIILKLSSIHSQDYSFYKIDNYGLIRDVEYHNDKIYLLCLNSKEYSIQVFDIENKNFEVIYSQNKLKGKSLNDIKDMVFFENDLYVINDNKLINLSNGYTVYSLADEYDFEPHSDKYRQMYNLTVRGNSILIGSSSADVLTRDTLQGTPFAYVEGFNELLEYNSGSIKRIVDERNSKANFNLNFSPVIDNQNNLWFRENQSKPLKGGLIKVSPKNEVEVFDLKPYSQVSYLLKPSSIDIIDNLLYVGLFPQKESNYLEGLSIYNLENKEWKYTIDYLENKETFWGINWEVPTKIKRLKNGYLTVLGSEFTLQNDNDYIYFELTKTQKEKYGVLASYDNLDLLETESKYIIIRQSGILLFDKSTISNVKVEPHINEISTYPNPTSTLLSYETNNITSIIQLNIVDLSGKVLINENIDDAMRNSIDVSKLQSGVYFLQFTDVKGVKYSKEFVIE